MNILVHFKRQNPYSIQLTQKITEVKAKRTKQFRACRELLICHWCTSIWFPLYMLNTYTTCIIYISCAFVNMHTLLCMYARLYSIISNINLKKYVHYLQIFWLIYKYWIAFDSFSIPNNCLKISREIIASEIHIFSISKMNRNK